MEKKANGYTVSNPELFIAMINKNPIFKIFKSISKDREYADVLIWVTFVITPDDRPIIKKVGTDEVLGKAISIKINEDNSLMVLLRDKTVFLIEPYATIKRKNLLKKPNTNNKGTNPNNKKFNKNKTNFKNNKKPVVNKK